MQDNNRIALIHGVYFPDNARLDTMPFVLNCLRKLAASGWPIDVFLWEQPGERYRQLLPPTVIFHYQNSPMHDPRTAESFREGPGFRCVLGTGQMGAYAAAMTAARNDCPLILLNNELPSQWGNTPLLQAETAAAARAQLLVVPDACRAAPLLAELQLPPDTPCATIPNGPVEPLPATEEDWHARLNVAPGKALCLNAGSISDFAQVAELMTTVPLWADDAVLVLNERNRGRLEEARRTFAHLDCNGRVIWNPESLSEENLHSLVAAATLNFALYRNSGPNIEYAGFSSGKLMRSLAAGTPVIASRLSSFRFIEEHSLGVLVGHPLEIPDAIADVRDRRDTYAANCRAYYEEHCRFEPHWTVLCEHLLELTGLDLREV